MGRPRCSALKWGSSAPEPELLRDLVLAIQEIESTKVEHPYIYMDGAQDSWRLLAAWSFLWRLGTVQGLDLYSPPLALIMWDWRRKSFLVLHSSCLPSMWVTLTVETAFTWSLTGTARLLHTQTKIQAPSFSQNDLKPTNLKLIAPRIHPEEPLGVWSKNRKVMVEPCAGVPDAAQSRKQKAWGRGLHRGRYSLLLLSQDFFWNVHLHHTSETTDFILYPPF